MKKKKETSKQRNEKLRTRDANNKNKKERKKRERERVRYTLENLYFQEFFNGMLREERGKEKKKKGMKNVIILMSYNV